MNLAISNIAWLPDEDDDVFVTLMDHGVSNIELAPTRTWGDWRHIALSDAADTRRSMEKNGVRCVAMQSLLYGLPDLQLFGSRESRGALAEHLVRVGQLASEAGISTLVFGSPGNRRAGDLSPSDSLNAAAETLGPVAEALAPMGVALCIEANPPEYDCDFVTTSADAVALAHLIDSPGFRVHLDAGGLCLAGEPIADAVQAAGPFLAHVHISEPFLARLDATNSTHGELAEALRVIGYAGYCSVEMRRQDTGSLDAVRDALTLARRLYGERG